jgi:serine O-acetyltransferase
MLERIREDVRAVLERDPAARNVLEVLCCYPGLHALWLHRVAHAQWNAGFRLAGRLLSHLSRFLTGVEIHPGAEIGRRVVIDHGAGVVIGETAAIGDDVHMYHGVTLGGNNPQPVKRHPTIEDGAVLGANATLIGDITIGEGAKIGAGAVVTKPVPAGATMVGNPARRVDGGETATGTEGATEGDEPTDSAEVEATADESTDSDDTSETASPDAGTGVAKPVKGAESPGSDPESVVGTDDGTASERTGRPTTDGGE